MRKPYKPPSTHFLKRKILPILRKYDVKKAGLFPTFANDESIKHSRLGIILEFGPEARLFDLIDIKRQIESVIDRYIDVTTYKAVLPRFRDHIDRHYTPIL